VCIPANPSVLDPLLVLLLHRTSGTLTRESNRPSFDDLPTGLRHQQPLHSPKHVRNEETKEYDERKKAYREVSEILKFQTLLPCHFVFSIASPARFDETMK
jgi:hypothetical protein